MANLEGKKAKIHATGEVGKIVEFNKEDGYIEIALRNALQETHLHEIELLGKNIPTDLECRCPECEMAKEM